MPPGRRLELLGGQRAVELARRLEARAELQDRAEAAAVEAEASAAVARRALSEQRAARDAQVAALSGPIRVGDLARRSSFLAALGVRARAARAAEELCLAVAARARAAAERGAADVRSAEAELRTVRDAVGAREAAARRDRADAEEQSLADARAGGGRGPGERAG